MKNHISTSAALLAAAAVMFVGCGEAGGGDTGSVALEQMQTTNGTCNATVARALRAAQECFKSGCEPGRAACDDVTAAGAGFFGNPVCATAFANGELDGLVGNASIQPAGPNEGAAKRIGVVICTSIAQCGLCPGIPEGTCVESCPQ